MRAPVTPTQALLFPLLLTGLLLLLVPWLVRQQEQLPAQELRLLRTVHSLILERHILEHEPEELMHSAISGMVATLDRHSRYVPPQENRQFDEREITGTYKGIGVVMVQQHSPPTVLFPFDDGPADRAGLRTGDRILEVDGHSLRDVPPEDAIPAAIERIKGRSGSVELRIGRDGSEEFRVEVERAAVRRPAIRWQHLVDADRGIGYLQVVDFQQEMLREFDAAVEALRAQGLRALVVDLRHNPGGLLLQATGLANRFLPDGDIVLLKDRNGTIAERHQAEPDRCTLPDIPLAVLIDGSSASASEVFAGAVQDRGRGAIVGTRSFGKGVVQEIIHLTDDISLKLTTSHYYTPAGRNIERQLRREEDGMDPGGIEPDHPVALDEKQRLAILQILHPDNHVPSPQRVAAVQELSEQLEKPVPRPLSAEQDPQLAEALDVLRKQLDG